MSNTTTESLNNLFTTFQVSALGQGDVNAGANLLASMACVLADLAATDGTVVAKDGKTVRLGVNLLVGGSASAGVVVDEVLTEVGLRQTKLSNYLQRYAELIEQQREKVGAILPPMGPKAGSPEDRIAETQQELDPLFGSRADTWSRILRDTPEEEVTDLIARPRFLVSVADPEKLDSQLQGLRPGNPLLHVGFTRPADLAALATSGAALVEGRYPLGDGCEAIRGHFLITDPMRMLEEAAKASDECTAWLGHFLWLHDGDAGPEALPEGNAANAKETTTVRFAQALDLVITRRLNLPKKEPLQLPADTHETKVRFRAFLRDMEPQMPGISGAARNLIDSLVFGLWQMARAEKGLKFSLAGVEAFARFLVKRMANARTMLLHAGAVAQRRSQIERVYRKLSRGRTDARKIYRNLSLPARDCDGCLRWLQREGIARSDEDLWELVDSATLDFDSCSLPILEA